MLKESMLTSSCILPMLADRLAPRRRTAAAGEGARRGEAGAAVCWAVQAACAPV